MKAIVTGGAGFIGSHLCERLLAGGHAVVAVDSFDPFYDPAVKRANLAAASSHPAFRLVEADIAEGEPLVHRLADAGARGADVVVHLAARAGVRPSIDAPLDYARTNVEGTVATLEAARRLGIGRFVFGSSSSVYGDAASVPFREDEPADAPISPYAATKRAGELLCRAWSHLHGLSVVCLRLFTVYGPRQRPDLAIHKFARLMERGEPIPLFGDGGTERDYTYVDDVLQGIEAAIRWTGRNPGGFETVNLGENDTVTLRRLVDVLSAAMGVAPEIRWLPEQPGDVRRTCADLARARRVLGYDPRTRIEEGIPRFVQWFRAQGA